MVLEKVCEYLYYNQKHADSKDVSDMDIPPELCLELLIAADYLDGRLLAHRQRRSQFANNMNSMIRMCAIRSFPYIHYIIRAERRHRDNLRPNACATVIASMR